MIKIESISKQFGKVKALDNVSAACQPSQCIALIGPNGSGKTTLIKTVLGMVVPNSGNIIFNGINISGKWHYREQIGYMPQIGRYPDNMTIGQVIKMMKDIRQNKNEFDETLVEKFSLND